MSETVGIFATGERLVVLQWDECPSFRTDLYALPEIRMNFTLSGRADPDDLE